MMTERCPKHRKSGVRMLGRAWGRNQIQRRPEVGPSLMRSLEGRSLPSCGGGTQAARAALNGTKHDGFQ